MTGAVLGEYATEADADKVAQLMISDPLAPHWLQLIKLDGQSETLVQSDIGLSWKIFGPEAVRPVLATSLDYFTNKLDQMAEWMPFAKSEELFGRWREYEDSATALLRTFVEADGRVTDPEFFASYRRLAAEWYVLAAKGHSASHLERPRDVKRGEVKTLHEAVRSYR
jgi:hypothetical protein